MPPRGATSTSAGRRGPSAPAGSSFGSTGSRGPTAAAAGTHGVMAGANAAHASAMGSSIGNHAAGSTGPFGSTHTGGPAIGIGSYGAQRASSLQQMDRNIGNWAHSPADAAAMAARNMGWGGRPQMGGVLGTFGAESGFDPNAVGDAGKSHGLGQWKDSRFGALNSFAKSMGMPANNPTLQMAFFDHEIRNNPQYGGALRGLQRAQTPAQGVAAMNAYERPNGYVSGGAPQLSGVNRLSSRLGLAGQYADQTGVPHPGMPLSTSSIAGIPTPQPKPMGMQQYEPGSGAPYSPAHYAQNLGLDGPVPSISAPERMAFEGRQNPVDLSMNFGGPQGFGGNQVPSSAFGQLSQPASPSGQFAGNQVPEGAYGQQASQPSHGLAMDPTNQAFRNSIPVNDTVQGQGQPSQPVSMPPATNASTGFLKGDYQRPIFGGNMVGPSAFGQLSQPMQQINGQGSFPAGSLGIRPNLTQNPNLSLSSLGQGPTNIVPNTPSPSPAPGQPPMTPQDETNSVNLLTKLRDFISSANNGGRTMGGYRNADPQAPWAPAQAGGGNPWNTTPPPGGNTPPPQNVPWPILEMMQRAYSNPWSYRNPWQT